MNAPALLTIDEVAAMLNCNRATVRRAWYAGRFVQPIRLGRRGVRWRRADVEHWIQSQPGKQPAKVEA